MTRAQASRSRQDFRAATGVLLVLRDPPPAPPPAPGQPAIVAGDPAEGPEILLALWDDGSVTALHGHVDLGTGLRTALAQVVAEELEVELAQVHMVLGDTAAAPNQGATIASASIQIHAAPLRAAAAQARAWLLAQAVSSERPADASLLAGRHVELTLDLQTPLKPASEHRVVGHSVPRVDIPAKAAGEAVYVHDMRLPGMLHGRVVRPPYAGLDAGEFVGNTLESVDEGSVASLPGFVALVRIRDFVGVVCEREEQAEAALRALHVRWKPWPAPPSLQDLEQAISANPSTPRLLVDEGDVDGALAGAAQRLTRTYVWPYQLHASIGPSCALADWRGERCTVWAGTQNPHVLRADLAKLVGLPALDVEVVRMEAAGCYGRNGADDVAADALLLARAVGRPVRVQLTREQEHAWEPKGAAQLMQVDGGLDAAGAPLGYDFRTSYPSNGAPTLALLLTRTVEPIGAAYAMGDRTARPPYDYTNLRVVANDMAPILRASWLRGVSALPNSFAHESYVDELASAAGVDPVAYRLRHLKDERAAELVRATAARAGWKPHTAPQQQPRDGDLLKGQGFAYARYVHSKWPGSGAAWAAWVADVEVNARTGEVHVGRVVVGHDAGLMINPAGVQQQIHGNVLQTTSRALKERAEVDPQTGAVATRDWGSYPILNFREVPVVEVLMVPRPGEPPLGAGESASVPGTAAIANAIFDATGVRFRQPPFTPEVVRAALNPLPGPSPAPTPTNVVTPPVQPPADVRWPLRRSLWARGVALAGALVGIAGAALGWRAAIAPIAQADASVYNAATLARGRELAALGGCVNCHTAPGGTPLAGGRTFETPFGTVVATNLTPDPQTGIGRWSYAAFERAMREGISRDGRHLYPVFPYPAFARAGDADLQALYAWLIAQPAVRHEVGGNTLRFPFGFRPLMAAWNALYLDAAPLPAEPARSALWNRGAYLVESLGHCGACHTPRDALGAERTGASHLAGGVVAGWEAPALTALSKAPLPWTEAELYAYLRTGVSDAHGVAAGPMAAVVRELQVLPDDELRAMAHYLAGFNGTAEPQLTAQAVVDRAAAQAPLPDAAQRLFTGACGACHHDGDGPVEFGRNVPLALNSNLHGDSPDNLLHTILSGIRTPATREIAYMPAFRDALDDRQLAQLAAWMRRRFAPDKPAWTDLEAAAARVRAARPHD